MAIPRATLPNGIGATEACVTSRALEFPRNARFCRAGPGGSQNEVSAIARRDDLLWRSLTEGNPIMKRAPNAGPKPALFLTVPQFAEELILSDKTIRRFIKAGELHKHVVGGQIRISREDANTFIASRRR
jgi:excisionase family DNA binding protein